jgi:NAD(P) transhydrogenase
MAQAKDYDFVVIGAGPAGIFGAITATVYGKTVALVDSRREIGGAGINTGTVPSKTLRETAVALSGMRSRNLYGVDLSLRREATVADFLRHEQHVKAGMNEMAAQQLQEDRVDIYCGTGSLVDAHTVQVRPSPACRSALGDRPSAFGRRPIADCRKPNSRSEEALLCGRRVLIATGSAPVRPETFPFGPGVYDSDTILELERLPKTMAVVGAGSVGSEYACTFAALGAKIHLLDDRDVLMPYLDAEISWALAAAMQRNGIIFHWKERVESCEAKAPGKAGGVTLRLKSGEPLTVDAVLISVGRKSNVESLNLSAAGVNVGERGLIHVDEHFRTNVPDIYAVGDVIGFPALASTAMEQARRAVQHALDKSPSPMPRLLPHGIFTIPEIGMVGETEEALKKKGIDYCVGRASYQNCARGRIIGDTAGFLKLLLAKDDKKLLGVHVMGEQATDLVHIGLMAMLMEATADIFDGACFNLPTLSELYKFATFDAMGVSRPYVLEGSI